MTIALLLWISAGIIAYAYFGYPLWIFLCSRMFARKWRQAEIYPSVSIIVAVHNGAQVIRDKVKHLLSLDYPADRIQLIVVSDGSDDGTSEVLTGLNEPRLISIICPEHRGKANAINHAITRATGEILVFVDIRPKLEWAALHQIVSNFADPAIGCVAGELCLRVSDHDAGTEAVSSLYWRYEQGIRKCEALFDSPVGVYGGFYAVRRELATIIPDGLILDDMYQPLSIVRMGFRSVIDDRARVWDIWPKSSAMEFNRKVRTLAGNYQLIQKAPWLLGRTNRLRFQLISHKLARLVVPLLLMVLLMTSFALRANPGYMSLLVAQIAFYALAVAGLVSETRILRKITGPPSAFILLNAAAVVALFMFAFRTDSLLALWVQPKPQAEEQPVRAA
jgi:cellulose synthase/poly-beta-1,6-N-acetylglucosamine synthase-like glycosyltransferase